MVARENELYAWTYANFVDNKQRLDFFFSIKYMQYSQR